MFYRGQALGVVVEHQPRQCGSAFQILPIDHLAEATDPDALAVARAIGLPAPEALPWVTRVQVKPLIGLVDVLDGDDLPLLSALNPYRLGATPTQFGDKDSYGQHDP